MPNRREKREARFGKPATTPLPAAQFVSPSVAPLKMEGKDWISLCLAAAMWLIPLPASENTRVYVGRFLLVGVFLVRPVLHLPWIAFARTQARRWAYGASTLLAVAGLLGLL